MKTLYWKKDNKNEWKFISKKLVATEYNVQFKEGHNNV